MPLPVRLLSLVVAAVVLPACGPGPALYAAEVAPTATVVDGDVGEWPSALRPVPGEGGLVIGLRREGDDLIVAVIATDERQTRRVVLGGLTVWVDPDGGTDRALGIRYPAPDEVTARDLRDVAAARDGDTADTPALRRRYQAGTEAVVVTRGVVAQRTQGDGRFRGLEVASTWGRRGLAVEMRVPLSATSGLLDTQPTEAVGLGIELIDGPRSPRSARPRGEQPPRPQPDEPLADQTPRSERPAIDLPTVTRWLRIHL